VVLTLAALAALIAEPGVMLVALIAAALLRREARSRSIVGRWRRYSRWSVVSLRPGRGGGISNIAEWRR
jgi:hypothetical protein